MSRYVSSDEDHQHQPVTWLNGHPIYAAHFIVVVFVASLLVSTIMMAAHFDQALDWLVFNSTDVWHGQLWRIFTYGLVNRPSSLWFIVDMFMIVWFGREVERFFGRRTFLALFASLYLATPVLFTAIGYWRPTALAGETGGFALFIAFATLYPNAVLMFNILAKWFALMFVGFYTLIYLGDRNWIGLLSLAATAGLAFIFVRFQQGRFSLPRLPWRRRRPALRVLPDLPTRKAEPTRSLPDASMAEVDALLDKIARSGISSLTARERARLDEARAALRKKNR